MLMITFFWQLTAVNHYLDLSIVYGNNDQVNQQVRQYQGGRLRVEVRNGQQWPPQNNNVSQCAIQSFNEPCYLAGRYLSIHIYNYRVAIDPKAHQSFDIKSRLGYFFVVTSSAGTHQWNPPPYSTSLSRSPDIRLEAFISWLVTINGFTLIFVSTKCLSGYFHYQQDVRSRNPLPSLPRWIFWSGPWRLSISRCILCRVPSPLPIPLAILWRLGQLTFPPSPFPTYLDFFDQPFCFLETLVISIFASEADWRSYIPIPIYWIAHWRL